MRKRSRSYFLSRALEEDRCTGAGEVESIRREKRRERRKAMEGLGRARRRARGAREDALVP